MSCNASEKKILDGSSVSSRSFFRSSSYASPDESAFWKIVGFDVTPVTASSFIIFSSSPVLTRSRESVSNQTACPRSLSSCSRDFAIFHLPFHLGDLEQPRHVAFAAVEGRIQKCRHELARQRRAHDLGAEAQHVHVVVLDALMRAVGVVTDRCPDARHLARGNRRAHARAAHEHRALGATALDRLTDLARLLRVVEPHRVRVRAEIDHLVTLEHLEHCISQVHSPVVESDGDLHDPLRPAYGHSTSTRAILPSSKVKRIGNVLPSAWTIASARASLSTSMPSTCTAGISPSTQKPGETSAKNSLIDSDWVMRHAREARTRGQRRCRGCNRTARARSFPAPMRRSARSRSSRPGRPPTSPSRARRRARSRVERRPPAAAPRPGTRAAVPRRAPSTASKRRARSSLPARS